MSGESLVAVRKALDWLWNNWIYHTVHGRLWGSYKVPEKRAGSHITFFNESEAVDIFERDGVPVITKYLKMEKDAHCSLALHIKHILDRQDIKYDEE